MIKLACLILLIHVSAYSLAVEVLPRYEHYNPVVLNEHALDEASKGNVSSAVVMLERAALLAPHDPQIQHNLKTLRAWRDGSTIPAEGGTETIPAAAKQAKTADPSLPPFPLWPKK